MWPRSGQGGDVLSREHPEHVRLEAVRRAWLPFLPGPMQYVVGVGGFFVLLAFLMKAMIAF